LDRDHTLRGKGRSGGRVRLENQREPDWGGRVPVKLHIAKRTEREDPQCQGSGRGAWTSQAKDEALTPYVASSRLHFMSCRNNSISTRRLTKNEGANNMILRLTHSACILLFLTLSAFAQPPAPLRAGVAKSD